MLLPYSNPSRIRLARHRRGKTIARVAAEVGVSVQLVAKWETGERDPGDRLPALALALDFPEEFFYGEDVHSTDPAGVSFRRRRASTKALRERNVAAGDLAADVVSPGIHRYLELPEPDLPDLSGSDPTAAARSLRQQWGLGSGPIANMVHLLEAKGVEVFFVNEASDCVDGFCLWRDDRPFVFLSTVKPDGARGRFDAAHELAHLVLHPGRDFEACPDDEAEREANAFASAFLLPAETFGYEAPAVLDLPAFGLLRSRWGASIQAMVRRLRDLGRFTPWQYENAMIRMSGMGWRSGPEPGAPRREDSYVHARLLEHLGDGGLGPREFAASLHLPLEDLCTLLPQARPYATPIEDLFNPL
ncbi:MAG: ImmA/IrrE family metallo-endopeptidase [Fimbriimonas sp.]